ncbi:2-amino-4-hydroxy-6-hydroxymethyldihydropteridine diphosphokinase [Vibrio campbellii]|uniref:2-amino-4-hydroxy-6- hydroxymethyldihydropteridine diphosphokinase n=1 Tax=Vibrio campbellii TaxID=680 RepID=UPI0005F015DE|nr:2-amino-4-hydroxy-6-hydroxymethyldihydropteridine diphosphokinase [Vibrio campbellii]
MNNVVLGMGSNINHSLSFFEEFFTLDGHIEHPSVSQLAMGEAVGSIGSPVSNIIVIGKTQLSLEALTKTIKCIEKSVNTADQCKKWYSIDIDLLFFNGNGVSYLGKEMDRSYYIDLVYSKLFD